MNLFVLLQNNILTKIQLKIRLIRQIKELVLLMKIKL